MFLERLDMKQNWRDEEIKKIYIRTDCLIELKHVPYVVDLQLTVLHTLPTI